MKCRTMTEDGKIVWFGSVGLNYDGTAKKVNDTQESYSYDEDATVSSLRQRLSVLKGELWYNVMYGIPLSDKIRNKLEMDMFIIQALLEHEDVVDVIDFTSTIVKSKYTCNMTIKSIYGDFELSV